MSPIKRYNMEVAYNMQKEARYMANEAREYLFKALENPDSKHYLTIASYKQRISHKLSSYARIAFDDFMCEK